MSLENRVVKVLIISSIVGTLTYAWPQRTSFRFHTSSNSLETHQQFNQFQNFQRPQREFSERRLVESNSFLPINQDGKRSFESQPAPQTIEFHVTQRVIPTTTETILVNRNNSSKNEKSSANISESCLACICTASTDCNLTTECINGGQYCGPFMISKPYWIDAGMLTLHGDDPLRSGAFEDCSTDPVCASQSVRNYMRRFHQDCNFDGKVDCDDLGRIHMMGPTSCGKQSVTSTPFYKRFRKCFEKVIQLNGQSS